MLKKVLSIFLCVVISVFSVVSVSGEVADKPNISAESAVLYCVNDGKIYYSLNKNKRMKNASTTKILSALITLEEASVNNKQVKFTNEMTAEGSSMYLETDDVVTLYDLACGMLICSGNDSANASAIAISGSLEEFAKRMNTKAKELGMNNSNFVTPSGLDDDNHYSTACDLAKLMAYAMENKDFAEITGKKSVTVDFISPKEKSVTYQNHNRLLSLYEYCIGGKTGYTMSAGRCLVSFAEKNGLQFVCVTLNDKNDWDDHIALYEYGFKNYALCSCDDRDFYLDVAVVGGQKDNVTVEAVRNYGIVMPTADALKVKRTVYLDNFIYAPVKQGDYLGKIVYTLNNKQVAEIPISATETVNIK